MAEQKPTVAGLMQIVELYGHERMIGMEMNNEQAIKRAYLAVRQYAERLSTPGVDTSRGGQQ